MRLESSNGWLSIKLKKERLIEQSFTRLLVTFTKGLQLVKVKVSV